LLALRSYSANERLRSTNLLFVSTCGVLNHRLADWDWKRIAGAVQSCDGRRALRLPRGSVGRMFRSRTTIKVTRLSWNSSSWT